MAAPTTQPKQTLSDATDEGMFGPLLKMWSQFWFAPSDVLPLALLRILCGLLVLYVHVLYSWNLQEFFGPQGWWDTEMALARRKAHPTLTQPWEYGTKVELDALSQRQESKLKALEDLSVILGVDKTKFEGNDVARFEALRAKYLEFIEDWNIDPSLLKDLTPEEQETIKAYGKRYGVDPRKVHGKGLAVWSIWFYVQDPHTMQVLHGAFLFIIVCFTLGLFTPVTGVLTWLATVSYIQRATTVLLGQDTMMNILLLYLMLSPCGQVMSLDRWLRRWLASRYGDADALARVNCDPEPSVHANFIIRLVQVHLCFIYLAAGCSKLLGHTWWGGIAVWNSMANYSFAPLNRQWYAHFLLFLVHHRWLLETFMTTGILLTFFVEIGFPFMVWDKRWRWVQIVAAIFLHVGIALVMGLVVFQLFMLLFVLMYLPPHLLHRFVDPIRESTAKRLGWLK